MKHNARKLLSLLMALAIVCSLMPAALAARYDGYFLYPYYPNNSPVYVGYNSYEDFSVRVDNYYDGYYDITYEWTLYDSNGRTVPGVGTSAGSGNSSYRLYGSNLTNNSEYVLTCEAVIDSRYRDSVSWKVYGSDYNHDGYYYDLSVSATVYDTNGGYRLGDTDDEGGRSIVDQIERAISYNLDYVEFVDVTDRNGDLDASTSRYYYADGYTSSNRYYRLSDVVFTPDTTRGNASFNFRAYDSRGNSYRGTMTFKVIEGVSSGSSSAIVYSAANGENVELNSNDFEDYWEEMYSRGSLDYVVFTNVSSGNLYADYNGRGSNVVGSTSSGTACYANPRSNRTGIDDVTYVPSSSSRDTVTIRFTAYGTTTSSSSSNIARSGTVTIYYAQGNATAIEYTSTSANGTITLNPSDFTAKYNEVVGKTNSNISIRFRSVPSNGTLTYQASSSRSVNLTRSNIGDYNFTSSSRGSQRISDVVYVPGRAGTSDTVEYACYNGGTLRFIGTITFNAAAPVQNNFSIDYTCTSSSGVGFNYLDFFGSSTAMASSSYIMFGTPSSGALYVNDTPVGVGTQFAYAATTGSGYQNLSSIVYKPAANYNGVVLIAFTAFNANHTMAASGTVRITVNQPATSTPSTPSTPPTSTGSAFRDIPSNAWYGSAVSSLVQAGVIGGYDDGTFRPNNSVTYGEALKMIMRAAGYSAQPQGTGADWAINYKNVAVNDGLVGADIVLSSNISRSAVASLAARALKLTPVTDIASPFADTSDGYVLALYQAGIIKGDGTGRYNGGNAISRAEISAVIYRINTYRTPVNTTPDTSMPGWLLS